MQGISVLLSHEIAELKRLRLPIVTVFNGQRHSFEWLVFGAYLLERKGLAAAWDLMAKLYFSKDLNAASRSLCKLWLRGPLTSKEYVQALTSLAEENDV